MRKRFFASCIITLAFSANTFCAVEPSKVNILTDSADANVVGIVAEALAKDIRMVTGACPQVTHRQGDSRHLIIAGTVGRSAFIDRLARLGRIDTQAIRGRWEAFGLQTVKQPMKGVDEALVVYGSDPRGTAYGMFEISRRMGVSPWVWWADVTPERRPGMTLDIDKVIDDGPDVKFRGIFINDEGQGFNPWAKKMMDPDVKNAGPNTYAHVFELLLRLRANMIWPAMHKCSKSFWLFDGNPEMARRYGIVVGSSHCEPLLTNSYAEWSKKFGEYNFATNRDRVMAYFARRVVQSRGMDVFYTMGMRGIHDLPIQGYKTTADKVRGLTEIIAAERKLLQDSIVNYNHSSLIPNLSSINQMFCPYKEVLEAYNAGLKVPDDIMMCWVNDNHGYIRQLPNEAERRRSGGHGMYYHLSYWGAPKQWTWLSSISPALTAFEMHKAYDMGVRKMWIANVGDIKPAEAEAEFFLDMAWDIRRWTPVNAHKHPYVWAGETFGKDLEKAIGDIKTEYYRLAAGGKPEHITIIEYTSDEIVQRLESYARLVRQVDEVKPRVPERLRDAFFELIEYPVKGAAAMNAKVLYERKSLVSADSIEAACFASEAVKAHKEILSMAHIYNKVLAGGKWNGMMGISQRWRPEFLAPFDTVSKTKKEPKVVNIPDGKFLIIKATGYKSKSPQVQVVYGLGVNGAALVKREEREKWNEKCSENVLTTNANLNLHSFPHTPHSTNYYIDYKIKIKKGVNRITVMCVPSFPLNKDYRLRYAVSIDGDEPRIIEASAEVGGKTWSENVLRGYTSIPVTYESHKKRNAKVRISLIDPGLAIEGIKVE